MSGAVLVVNAGSTSLKLSIVAPDDDEVPVDSLQVAHGQVVAVGHRLVHGGAHFREPMVIDDDVERRLMSLVALAPLHMHPALDAIRQARAALPDVPHVAAFDTAFHATIPDVAADYALPADIRDQHGIRRYGFHGLSVQWAAQRVPVPRLVVCHLGGGCSVTAVRDGSSIDTTMGFTPLDGVPMATRSGAVDPGVLLYLLRAGMSVDELDRLLEQRSGLLGLSGESGSVKDLETSSSFAADHALKVFEYRVATAIGAAAVALDGLDAIVFTAGIGEHSPRVRANVCARLGTLGVRVDDAANAAAAGHVGDAEVAASDSGVRIVVVHAREGVVIARAARTLVEN
jgi:acetate kinase